MTIYFRDNVLISLGDKEIPFPKGDGYAVNGSNGLAVSEISFLRGPFLGALLQQCGLALDRAKFVNQGLIVRELKLRAVQGYKMAVYNGRQTHLNNMHLPRGDRQQLNLGNDNLDDDDDEVVSRDLHGLVDESDDENEITEEEEKEKQKTKEKKRMKDEDSDSSSEEEKEKQKTKEKKRMKDEDSSSEEEEFVLEDEEEDFRLDSDDLEEQEQEQEQEVVIGSRERKRKRIEDGYSPAESSSKRRLEVIEKLKKENMDLKEKLKMKDMKISLLEKKVDILEEFVKGM